MSSKDGQKPKPRIARVSWKPNSSRSPLDAALHAMSTLPPSLGERLQRHEGRVSPSGRGREFEQLVLELLVSHGFRVRRNVRAASPRQVDLYAEHNRREYLIEVKSRQKPINVGDIDALRARLARIPTDVVGVLFSLSEYSRPALD